jgi:DNA-binding transcriptional LysR family regulator
MEVACRPGHRIARQHREQRGVDPRDLAREPIVTFDRGLAVRREIDRFLRRHEVDVTVAAEFDNIENIKQAVDEEAGIAILPEPTLRREVRRRTLVQAPLALPAGEPPLVRPLSIVHRSNRRLHPAVTEFIKLLGADETARATAAAGTRPTARPRGARPGTSVRTTGSDPQGANP